jgi:hypothetical protein
VDRAVADHAHIGFRNPQVVCDIGSRLLVIEGHHDHRAFPLFQTLHTPPELVTVEAQNGKLVWSYQVDSKPFKQAFPSLNPSAQIDHHHPARSQDEGCKLLRFSQAACPQSLECRNQDLLGQILRRGSVSQVTQTIKPNAWGHPADQFGLSIRITRADLAYQVGIVQLNVHEHTFYV